MQQFIVPQFIDVEDKIIGPVTTRQFIIMLACFMLIAINYRLFDFSLFLTVSIILVLLFGIIAFITINGRPFHFFILNIIQTLKRPGLRVWNNIKKIEVEEEAYIKTDLEDYIPAPPKPLSRSRLSDLSLIVDTGGGYKD